MRTAVPLPFLCIALALAAGCASRHGSQSFTDGRPPAMLASFSVAADANVEVTDAWPYPELGASVAPPPGWRPDPIKRSQTHAHQVWVSPSGKTAYGVIRINLPLPFIGPDLVIRPFLEEMRRTEGEATLLSRSNDRRLPGPGIRFVAEGGEYKIRANLMTRGFRAWAVYAGTRRGAQDVPEELHLAEEARELTKIGLPKGRR